MRQTIFLIFLLQLAACSRTKNKTINIEQLSMGVPAPWTLHKVHGIDSKAYYLITDNKDTILIDIGKNVIAFDDLIGVTDIDSVDFFKKKGFPIDDIHFSAAPKFDENQGTFHKEFYYYDTINNKIAKLRVPKKVRSGRTSINFKNFIDSTSVTIMGNNLDSITQNQLLKAFYTITFNTRNDKNNNAKKL